MTSTEPLDVDFVSDPTDKPLHELGDKLHGQPTTFTPNEESDRYSWAIDPTNRSVLLCMDEVTQRCVAGPVTEDTRWVVEWLRETSDDEQAPKFDKTCPSCRNTFDVLEKDGTCFKCAMLIGFTNTIESATDLSRDEAFRLAWEIVGQACSCIIMRLQMPEQRLLAELMRTMKLTTPAN
jgi:hypothetical protein